MTADLKFERAVRRIEMMLLEIQMIQVDAEDIVRETEVYHEANFAEFDILNNDIRLAERAADDRISHAKTLRSSARQLRVNLRDEIARLRYNNPFA